MMMIIIKKKKLIVQCRKRVLRQNIVSDETVCQEGYANNNAANHACNNNPGIQSNSDPCIRYPSNEYFNLFDE